MEPHNRHILWLGIIALALVWVAALLIQNNQTSISTTHTPSKNKISLGNDIVAKNFYDWYRNQKNGVLDDTRTIAEQAKERGFITPEFVTTTLNHPLIKAKQADIFLCASKKSETAFPTTFIPYPATSSIALERVDATSAIPNHTIELWFKDKKISAITCPIIPNVQ